MSLLSYRFQHTLSEWSENNALLAVSSSEVKRRSDDVPLALFTGQSERPTIVLLQCGLCITSEPRV